MSTLGGGALFTAPRDADDAVTPMGERGRNGRYRLPPLPGEATVKSGAGHIPYGAQSMTNLAGSISDTKALGDWDRRQSMIGLGLHNALRIDLRDEVCLALKRGVDFQNLREHPEFTAELDALAERAKDISGANAARDAGIAMHDAWERRGRQVEVDFGLGGKELFNSEISALEELLEAADMEVIPELCERTVRNVELAAAGRFDNILLHRPSGRLLMADLKTKRKPFWTWLEMDGQLAGYAYAEWMLRPGGEEYEPGPRALGVDLIEGVILHMPSDGSEPRLRRADLVDGIETMRLARRVCTQRSRGKSAGRFAESYWPVS